MKRKWSVGWKIIERFWRVGGKFLRSLSDIINCDAGVCFVRQWRRFQGNFKGRVYQFWSKIVISLHYFLKNPHFKLTTSISCHLSVITRQFESNIINLRTTIITGLRSAEATRRKRSKREIFEFELRWANTATHRESQKAVTERQEGSGFMEELKKVSSENWAILKGNWERRRSRFCSNLISDQWLYLHAQVTAGEDNWAPQGENAAVEKHENRCAIKARLHGTN